MNSRSSHHTIAARFRSMNLILFAGSFVIMGLVMLLLLHNITTSLSHRYAVSNAQSAADILGSRLAKDLSLLGSAANSSAVANWMQDEDCPEKKALALRELSGIVASMHSYNIYVGIAASFHEYSVEQGISPEMFVPFDTLEHDNPKDAWFFNALASENSYLVSSAMDHVIGRNRIWLDHQVTANDTVVGVLCTGLEFDHILGELFARFGEQMRGLVVAADGTVHMDSLMLQDAQGTLKLPEQQLNQLLGISVSMEQLTTDALHTQTLRSGSYTFLSAVAVPGTNWFTLVLWEGNPLLDLTLFIPLAVSVLALLLAIAIGSSIANYRLIFQPLGTLSHSLEALQENREAAVYGTSRDDELGELARTIEDLFTKAHVDALTGAYNRRFMENNLRRLMEMLALGGGYLSIIMMDIDYFKRYNDSYGHDQGDACLREVAAALRNSVSRPLDFVARYGGEEFIAVLPHTDEGGAQLVAQKMLDAVYAKEIPHVASDVAPFVTISIGVVTGRVAFIQSWEDYVHRADEALYASKEQGRNRITTASL